MRLSLITLLGSLLVGCASSNVTVRVPSPTPVAGQAQLKIEVNDLRAPGVAASTRQAAFGVPMGNVSFDPSERQLVKAALEATLSQPGSYACDILEFGVNTNTTPLYWDVIGAVRLRLKKDGQEKEFFGTHTERTYLWPSEEILGRVVQESLRKSVQGLAAK
jgi:hypothetical protein